MAAKCATTSSMPWSPIASGFCARTSTVSPSPGQPGACGVVALVAEPCQPRLPRGGVQPQPVDEEHWSSHVVPLGRSRVPGAPGRRSDARTTGARGLQSDDCAVAVCAVQQRAGELLAAGDRRAWGRCGRGASRRCGARGRAAGRSPGWTGPARPARRSAPPGVTAAPGRPAAGCHPRSPVARSSWSARSAHGLAPSASKAVRAARSGSRDSVTRRWRRSHAP